MSSKPNPEDITLDEAVERWLRKRRTDSTDETIRGYRSRLNQFLEWADSEEIETVDELDSWLLDEYQLHLRDQGFAPTTIKGRLSTLRLWIQYLSVLDLVADDLYRAIEVPNLSKSEEQNEQRLEAENALSSIEFFRNSRRHYGTAMHAFMEIAWHVGARMGSIRGLDRGDFHPEDQTLEFRHRPATDTPLKNKDVGERYVGISEETCEAVGFYIDRERNDKRDRHGREPLFATRQGRASKTSLRAWSYQATQPCFWMECPHGKRRPSCEWTDRSKASQCPSSRSPHHIRTGSITWQLNQGYPIELVAKRVNASIQVIKQHYDQASGIEEFQERRKPTETNLDISNMEKSNE